MLLYYYVSWEKKPKQAPSEVRVCAAAIETSRAHKRAPPPCNCGNIIAGLSISFVVAVVVE